MRGIIGSSTTLSKSAISSFEAVMTKPCEKLFKKLPRNLQEGIKAKISEICKNPKVGYPFQDASMKGLLHDHVGSHSSNVLVVWSVDENEKLVVVEGVGSHNKMEDLQSRRKRLGYGYSI